MSIKLTAILGLALAATACSSPPKPPTVDDSIKRPVNVSEAVNLQLCRAELSAATIVLAETLTAQQRQAAAPAAPAPVLTVPSRATAAEPNQIFVINFPLGSAEINVPVSQQSRLVEQARAARFIVIRGRTDALADSLSETRLAQRRAEAAYRYLVQSVGLPAGGIRLSWQGAGDHAMSGHGAADRHANRRVEIELYESMPEVELLTPQLS